MENILFVTIMACSDKECNCFCFLRVISLGFETASPLYPSPLKITNFGLNAKYFP